VRIQSLRGKRKPSHESMSQTLVSHISKMDALQLLPGVKKLKGGNKEIEYQTLVFVMML
jgi:hypothetical protein